jgi:hypothetical protein
MDVVLPLDKMTTAEKLQAIERLWDDLSRIPEDVTSPAWHEKVLADRMQRLRDGNSRFSELGEVRERIRKAAP